MNKIISIFSVLIFLSCKEQKKEIIVDTKEPVRDNVELIEIYRNDQADRSVDNIDWSLVSKRDSIREERLYELLDSNKVQTSKDYRHAAMIFQHGGDSIAYGMAVKLMRKSIELDSTADKWLLAAAIDRYLLSKNEPQIYGTQYQKFGHDSPWVIGKMDTTKISDEERIEYGVETLAEQKEKVKRLNQKKLSNLKLDGKSIGEIIKIVKSQDKSDPEYDISENEINSFGYRLMGEGKSEDALKIFKLNTQLYPNGFNTWDSLGECFLAVGKKDEALEAYRKSLELNPENENARAIIIANN
ncbi:tetratricopeptide repeat protein [Gramella sp. Hel_I_59]|uniref:tetratricopeptide repeat protein n=1 Tax=Gramella sp. Hel_I_59 TaxID=1249978 RepID=UPI001152A506|nr:tetratricopeptide repeat protein [Gramella sp. Hel_I_59]TQI71094.1 tetratricopeptide repeat protein [Gramella sp. Hel_I_59]